MSDDQRVLDALRELRWLTACRCLPPWTDRSLHQNECAAEYREDVDTLADALGLTLGALNAAVSDEQPSVGIPTTPEREAGVTSLTKGEDR